MHAWDTAGIMVEALIDQRNRWHPLAQQMFLAMVRKDGLGERVLASTGRKC